MKTGKGHREALLASIAIACIVAACLSLAACGGSGSSSAASSESAASSAAASSTASDSGSASSVSPSASQASSAGQFVGTWKLAAVEVRGTTMGGNFGELADKGSGVDMIINADGSGTLELGGTSGPFTWAAEDASSFYLTVQSETGPTAQQAILVTYKDGALFMPFEQDGQQMTAVFTKDGNYAGA